MTPDPGRYWDLMVWFESQDNLTDWEGLTPVTEVFTTLTRTLGPAWFEGTILERDLLLHLAYEEIDQGDRDSLTADWIWTTWNTVRTLLGSRFWMRSKTLPE